MNMKFNSRADVVGERNKLQRLGVMAESEQERLQFDTERMEREIRMLQSDGTQEDMQAIQQGIERVQSQVQNKLNQVLDNSRQVTNEMVTFEEGSEAAAERAREDADRMRALKSQVNNRSDFEARIEHLKSQKDDSSHFQDDQFRKMKAADDDLQRVVEQTKQAVHGSLNRRWG